MPEPRIYLEYMFKLEEDGSIVIPDLDQDQIEKMEITQGMLFEAEIDSEKNSLRFRRKP
jgi:hypothetical protein